MTNERLTQIQQGLIGNAVGNNTTRGCYRVLLAVKGENGKLYTTDMPLIDRQPVTQEELGEALALTFDDPEFKVGGKRYE